MTSDDIKHLILKASANALNQLADSVAADAIPETPLEQGTLRASEVYPGNDVDGSHTATEDNLESKVSFNTVYAAAQHEGWAIQHRGGKEVFWQVKNYSEPGTKSKFLEDPWKKMIPRMEPFIAASIRKAIDEGKG